MPNKKDMKTLELKHVLPYAAYELKYLQSFSGSVLTLKPSGIEYFIQSGDKPLLIPLDQLTQDQLKKIIGHLFQGNQFDIDFDKITNQKGFISFYDWKTNQNYVAIKPGREGLPVLNMSNTFTDYEVLFEMHVDLFNLIPSNLAINKLNFNNLK